MAPSMDAPPPSAAGSPSFLDALKAKKLKKAQASAADNNTGPGEPKAGGAGTKAPAKQPAGGGVSAADIAAVAAQRAKSRSFEDPLLKKSAAAAPQAATVFGAGLKKTPAASTSPAAGTPAGVSTSGAAAPAGQGKPKLKPVVTKTDGTAPAVPAAGETAAGTGVSVFGGNPLKSTAHSRNSSAATVAPAALAAAGGSAAEGAAPAASAVSGARARFTIPRASSASNGAGATAAASASYATAAGGPSPAKKP
ncbi:MAG: hypothetical protein H0X51_03075 [Parachlamydiaceae bacterium]|nr:hypothetical protein [Parachlamydiaceae bacterium]